MLEDTKNVIGKQLGPFKGWQWALIGGVPIGLWIFLSNRGNGDSKESPNPQAVGLDNSVYGPGDAAILARLQELSTVAPSGGTSGGGIPMANLSLLAANLERAAGLTRFSANSGQLRSWAGLLYDYIAGRAEYDQGVVDQIISFMRAGAIPLDKLLDEANPTNPPPTNPPPTNPPPTNPPPSTPARWTEGQELLRKWIHRAEEITDPALRSEYIQLVNGAYGDTNRAVAAGTLSPSQASSRFESNCSNWLNAAKY